MKYEAFFEIAKNLGIEEAELYIRKSYTLSFSLFHGEVDKYESNNGFSIMARGIVNGKFGAAACDSWSKEKAQYLANEIASNARVIENEDPSFIFEGSQKYKKISTFNKELRNIPVAKKLEKAHELETKIKAYSDKIAEIEGVYYEETEEVVTLMNSKGLKLNQKSNWYYYAGVVLAKDENQAKTNYDIFLDNDFSKFNVDKLAEEVAKGAIEQLGGSPCDSSNYKVVLAPNVVASLMQAYIGSADAEEIQKKSSLFLGKLNERVASNKVTIEDRPLDKVLFARGFDDEGVATYNKAIVKNGVLKTYLYNLTTAAKDGVQSTGNGSRAGAKMSTSPFYLVLKPGKKTQQELFEEVGDGVYVTEVSGLHAGLNPQSGNFSLQSSGFLITDGKKGRPLDIITVSGNLMKMFQDICTVGNDSKEFTSGTSCPSVIIKKLAISGK